MDLQVLMGIKPQRRHQFVYLESSDNPKEGAIEPYALLQYTTP